MKRDDRGQGGRQGNVTIQDIFELQIIGIILFFTLFNYPVISLALAQGLTARFA